MTINNSTNSRFFAFPFVINIDGTMTGTTTLCTVPSNFVPLGVCCVLTNLVGVVSGLLTANIGTNSPNYDNMTSGANVAPSFLNTYLQTPLNVGSFATSGQQIKINITTAESTATTFTLSINIYGIFL